MQIKLILLLQSAMLSPLAAASDMKPQPACHRLMTDTECSEHKAKLASLPPGQALERYLAEYARTQKDREAACNPARALASHEIVLQQRPMQQRF